MAVQFRIEPGDEVFVDDSEYVVGHVRRANPREVIVFVEDRGDFAVPRDLIRTALNGRVMLFCRKLPLPMRAAIGHLHGETYEEDDA
ncbi:MAG: hypothetical protein KGJ78_05060 [Alphaproteobacteria bacterium]|nr:hypothetical protein [Alphaproteobacteria bacterium]